MRVRLSSPKREIKILTIDDEAPVRESIGQFLEDCGYHVLEAENGKIGLERFYADKPDLVLVDLRMPEVDGLEVLSDISKTSANTPVVVISGTGVIADVVEALRHGAWDFLLKPIEDLEVLKHSVEKALERAELINIQDGYHQRLEEEVAQKTSDLTQALHQIKTLSLEVIFRLSKAADFKDEATGNHIKRISLYSSAIAKSMDLEPLAIEVIQSASPMHDIGKIGIPDRILLKPGKLTPKEWETMKSHTDIGARILDGSDIKFIQTAKKIALYHHERWDGRGYPQGLFEEEIPREARITAVADVFDALTTARPYKGAFPLEMCETIIADSSERAFDPQVVKAFFNSIDEIRDIYSEWKD